jgi:uncharacterized RDD family membrane protein YckC
VTIGASQQWSNGSYRFAAGTQPWALALAVLITFLYLLLLRSAPLRLGQPLPGVFRRFIAFWLDFCLGMMVAAPVFGLVPTFTEWRRTGIFQWTFERTTSASGDGILTVTGFLVMISGLICYFAVPLICRKPSPGSCIAGYQILAEDEHPLTLRTAVMRTLLGFIAVCVLYLAPFVARDRKKGQFWLDKVFGTRAVRLS